MTVQPYFRILLLVLSTATAACAAEPTHFDTADHGKPSADIPTIAPWKVVPLDSDYGGQWVVAADIDRDGAVEFIACENHNVGDVHSTSTAAAHKLDGTVMWRWGDPEIGRKNWHHDVACQIHDWDGDSNLEVILAAKGALVELDARTGKEKRRIAIPTDATDCIVFCDLSGAGRPTDVLVKDRYHNIYAYNHAGKQLWHVKDPGACRTAHQPRPMDLDGDGKDEIAAGYAMLNADGSVRWVFKSTKVDQNQGHLDCIRIARKADRPEDIRLVMTLCGANAIAFTDGNGKVIWELAGSHFESIDIGKVIADRPAPQILVDIDHQPLGKSPMCLIDENGVILGRINADYCRHHHLLDWTGDGLDEIFVAHSGAIYDHKGLRIATLAVTGASPAAEKAERSILVGDMTGDGILDATLVTTTALYIFENKHGKKADHPAPLGTESNFTLY